MYRAFENFRTTTKTQTNVRLFLADPKDPSRGFTNLVSFIIDGTIEVLTQNQIRTTESSLAVGPGASVGEIYMLPWLIGEMAPSKANSNIGEIKMSGNPGLVSTGVIRQNTPGLAFPATLEAAVYQVFEIPGYGRLHNKFPVIVDAVVDSIPPIGAVCACRCTLLLDDNNVARGMAAGRSLTFLGSA